MKYAGISLQDAGKKIEKPKGDAKPVVIEEKGPDVRYPSMSSYDGEIPGMDGMDVGEEYMMVARIKCTSKSTREEKGKTLVNGGFDILACGFKPEDGKMSHEEAMEAGPKKINERMKEVLDKDED
jgi:hypothetical protein